MAQPEYVPVVARDRVRVSERLPTPSSWVADRAGEVRDHGGQPTGPLFGSAGPDQGYALGLFKRLQLSLGSVSEDDARAAIVGVAMKRASVFGRAPVLKDLSVAAGLLGFLGGTPANVDGIAHDYLRQRHVVDGFSADQLRG